MPEKWPAAIPDASTLPLSRSRDQLCRLCGSFITVKICSTFSRSPIHTRFPDEFDDQIKLQRPDQAAGFAACITLGRTKTGATVNLLEFHREPRSPRLFDLWKWSSRIMSPMGPVAVELQTRLDALPTEEMIQIARRAEIFVRANGEHLLDLVYGHYKLAERENWLAFWGVPAALHRDQLIEQLPSVEVSVADDLYCCLHLDPKWDPEHKLYFTIANSRVIDVNGEQYALVGETLVLG